MWEVALQFAKPCEKPLGRAQQTSCPKHNMKHFPFVALLFNYQINSQEYSLKFMKYHTSIVTVFWFFARKLIVLERTVSSCATQGFPFFGKNWLICFIIIEQPEELHWWPGHFKSKSSLSSLRVKTEIHPTEIARGTEISSEFHFKLPTGFSCNLAGKTREDQWKQECLCILWKNIVVSYIEGFLSF